VGKKMGQDLGQRWSNVGGDWWGIISSGEL